VKIVERSGIKMVTRIDRNQLVEICNYLPYVTPLPMDKPRPYCDGWYQGGKCLKRAEWNFKKATSKGPGRAKSARYCDYHLLKSGIHYSKFEDGRMHRALNKNIPKYDQVQIIH
jgi:hypothetical protein